ncbi:hypothetical protein J2847_005809 [Azospirillum agricola]|uniref:hypothetical protein n=1 Tax=Azospirillum agricola TaxID=1720247 RepID=UPI001AE43FA9|nr:hypothetical protein [Azospirillum agricola]MBP2232480.1 hypothetical protein [Azospirillum agricola]
MLAACASMQPPMPSPRIRARVHADGRRSFPSAIQYRLEDGRVVDLPPTEEGAVYFRVVHDVDVVDRLTNMGALDSGHRRPFSASTVIDQRPTPGA